jgi:hypothetical protein
MREPEEVGLMGETTNPTIAEYFRRDQKTGISPPDLSKTCTYAEHVVHARGKRTQFTSITLDPTKCRDFGDVTYRLKRPHVDNDGHRVVEHAHLIDALRQSARESEKAERQRSLVALQYATRRLEGVVDWRFDVSSVERKDVIAFALAHVAAYFAKV